MNINSNGRFYHTFAKIFIILFVMLIIIPLIVDQAMHLINNGIIPRENSIIVFKDSVREKEVINRFIEILKKIRNYM